MNFTISRSKNKTTCLG